MTQDLAALVAQATPGPWEWAAIYAHGVHALVRWLPGETFPNGDPRYVQVHSDGSAGGEYGPDIDVTGPDARLIAMTPDLARTVLEQQATLEAQAAEIARLQHLLDLSQKTTEAVLTRAEKAEAALSESQAREAMLHRAITEASEQDFIWGAMDNVNDMDADITEFANAASRAIRASIPILAAAEKEASP